MAVADSRGPDIQEKVGVAVRYRYLTGAEPGGPGATRSTHSIANP